MADLDPRARLDAARRQASVTAARLDRALAETQALCSWSQARRAARLESRVPSTRLLAAAQAVIADHESWVAVVQGYGEKDG